MELIAFPVQEMLVLCVLAESLVEIVKMSIPQKLSTQGLQLISLVVSVGLSLLLGISIFTGERPLVTLVGSIILGAICSRGSNFVHGVIDGIAQISTSKK